MIRTLIVDDEPIARQVLRDELEICPDVRIVGEAENGEQALEQITTWEPDLVFLDLQMPGIGGFEVIRRLPSGHFPMIVIVTAFDQHAIRAFEEGAIDYLLKPVGQARLQKALERVRQLQGNSREIAETVARLSDVAQPPTKRPNRKIVGRKGSEYILLDAGEVLAFMAEHEIVWIVTAEQRYMATQSLRVIESRLQGLPFQRVHRNSIVNRSEERRVGKECSL